MPSARAPWVAPVTAAALGGALLAGSLTGSPVLLGAVVLVQVALIAGWPPMLELPGGRGAAVVGAATGVGGAALVAGSAEERPLATLAGVLAVGVLGGLLHQLARRDGRPELVASLCGTLGLVACCLLAVAHLATGEGRHGSALVAGAVVVAASMVAAPLLARVSGAPLPVDVGAGIAALVVTAAALLATTGLDPVEAGAVVSGCGAVAAAAVVLVRRAPAPSPWVEAALPLAVTGPVAYVLGRLLVG